MTTTQKIFAIATPLAGVTDVDLQTLMQLEAAHVWALHERGTVRDFWLRTDRAGAVYALEATPAEATDVLAAQPMARAGLVRFEVAPVAAFTCLVDLFGTQSRAVDAAPTPVVAEPWRRTQRVLAVDRLRDGVDAADLHAHLPEEARQTWALQKAGLVREAHRRTDRPGAVLVLETAGLDEADRLVGALPTVRAGLATYDLYALGAFTGLDALIDGAL